MPAGESLISLMLRLWRHLSARRQRQFVLLMSLMLVSVFAEIVSLGAVLPFIAVLAAPDRAFEYRLVREAAQALGFTSAEEIVLPLTIAFAVAALAAGAIRMLVLWLSTRFAFSAGADLSLDVYRRTLYQPYRVHIARGSSEVISGITLKVGGTTLGVLLPFVTLISSVPLLVAVLAMLLAIDTAVAMIAAAGFGVSYGAISWFTRRRLRKNSEHIAAEHTRVVKALQEGLGGIRDVLLDGSQPVYCQVYSEANQRLRRAQGVNIFIGQSPRFAMESLGMVMIAALAFGLSRQPGGIASALPVLGALALGAQRLLPGLQQAFASWASIAGNQGLLVDTLQLLDQPMSAEQMQPLPAPLAFKSAIRFDRVRFRYGEDRPWVLKDLELVIAKGARIGFVGSTGSGKSTSMDLLMGLLTPTQGQILVDEQPISGSLVRAWQRTIAHVPQTIYLADATVAENIALGVPREAIDLSRVREAARQAQVADFIESRAQGYDSLVGEAGVQLSGGQRQRIGIARALYKNASVLILDEATSALDNVTEQSVMEAIQGLRRDLTVLLIAHRLSTVRRCDSIVQLENGAVVAQGSYEHLLEFSDSFRQMAKVAATS